MSLPTPADGGAPSYFGLYPALVTNLVDPDSLGRVEVRLPWLPEEDAQQVRAWATLCTPYADKDQGFMVLPEVDSQVVVGFEAGNLRRPYVVGAAWNGRAALPETPPASNNLLLLKSRSGSRLEFDDSAGAAKVRLTTALGHEVVLDEAAQEVVVKHMAGCAVRLTVTAVEVTANAEVSVTAPMLRVNAPFAEFVGVVNVGTLIADELVMSAAYAPGAGQMW